MRVAILIVLFVGVGQPLSAGLDSSSVPVLQEESLEPPETSASDKSASREPIIRSVKLVLDEKTTSVQVSEGAVQLSDQNVAGKRISSATDLINAKDEIVLNATLPATGAMGLVGRDLTTGLNLIFDKFNKSGGLPGDKIIRYSALDDQYLSTRAKTNVMKGLESSPFFIGNYGSSLLATLQQMILNSSLLMLFPVAGDTSLRKPEFKNMVHFRPSIEREVEALLAYAIGDQNKKKIAVFYEENNWGRAGLNAAVNALKKYDLELVAHAYYPQNTINVMPAVREIVKQKPEAVLCISTYRPTYNFIQLVLNEGFQHCLFLGMGPATPMQSLLKKSRGVTVATSSVVPDPFKSTLPIVTQYRKDMAHYFPYRELSQYSLEGYIIGALFIAALRKLKPPYTIGKLIRSFERMKKKQFGGLKLNFNRETRELSSQVWVNKGSGEEWTPEFSG